MLKLSPLLTHNQINYRMSIVSELRKVIAANGGNPLIVGGANSTAVQIGKSAPDYPTHQAGVSLRPKEDGIFFYVPFFGLGGHKITWTPIIINRIMLQQLEQAVPQIMERTHPALHHLDATLINVGITLSGDRVVLDVETSKHINAVPAWLPTLEQGEVGFAKFSKDSMFSNKDFADLQIPVGKNSLKVYSGGQTRPLWEVFVPPSGNNFTISLGSQRRQTETVEGLLGELMLSRYHMGWYPGVQESLMQSRMNALVTQIAPLFEQRQEKYDINSLNELIELALDELLGEENDNNDSV